MFELHKKAVYKSGSQISVLFGSELHLFALLEVGVKTGLKCVDVDKPVKETQINASSLTFVLLGGEGAVEVLDSRVESAADIGKYSDHVWVLGTGVSVEEAVESE